MKWTDEKIENAIRALAGQVAANRVALMYGPQTVLDGDPMEQGDPIARQILQQCGILSKEKKPETTN